MLSGQKFATAINCIDGRVQQPVFNWMDLHCQVQYVDMITEPGADRILVDGSSSQIVAVRQKVDLSVQQHQSQAIAIVGHHDCLGNPVSHEEHLEYIRKSVRVITSWEYWVRIIGLYVNEWSAVDVIFDSEEEQEEQTIRSFL